MTRRSSGNQAWYHEGLRFSCTQCGQCCSGAPGFVWVSQTEIDAMSACLQMEPDAFRDKFVRRVGERESLIEYSDGDCIFLDPQTRGCMVYTARPGQCRTWPFWDSNLSSPTAWKKTCEICPGAGSGKLYSLDQIVQAKTRTRDIDDQM